jgi:valyl-tRNA synthetase
MDVVIEAVRRLRNYRDSVGAPAAARIPARLVGAGDAAAYERSLDAIARLARFDIALDGSSGDTVSSISLEGATVEVLPSDNVDPAEARARIDAERAKLRSEIERARGKLSNKGFTEKAPPELVRNEREKLERFEAELAELEG